MSSTEPPSRPEERIDLTGLGRLSERPPPPRGERAAPIIRAISVLLLAIAAAGLPWYLATRGGDGNDTGAAPTETTPETTPPTASPSPSPTAATYEVFGVSNCVNIRAEPTTRGKRLDCVTAGVRLQSDGRSAEGDGLLWRHVYDPFAKMWGWVADQYLKPVE